MFVKRHKKLPFHTKLVAGCLTPAALIVAATLASCGNINNSWEVKGGGYFKYSVNGSEKYTIKLGKDDCTLPQYNRHLFTFTSQPDSSKRGDQFSVMINNPSTNGKITPVVTAIINGKNRTATWMRQEFSVEAPLIADSSYVHFDEIISDSLWTANMELYFKNCRSGYCIDSLPPVHVSGRFRYWVAADER